MCYSWEKKRKQMSIKQGPLLVLLLGAVLVWFLPLPTGLSLQAWHLFIIFFTSILAVMSKTLEILTASVLALGVTLLSGTLEPKEAFSGFSEGFILLIVVAFLIAQSVIKSGLGGRVAFLLIERFGGSSLGLAYSIIAADMLIAPAFPSNTARSGVLFPLVQAVAEDSGSHVESGTRKRVGAFLMMCSMAGLTLSSTLYLTAMAANPVGAKIAAEFGVQITYLSWVLAAFLPVVVLYILLPWVIYKIYPPELHETPEAPKAAKEALYAMGPMKKVEYIVAAVFVGMIFLWVVGDAWGIDKSAVAFLGLGILMASGIFTSHDLKEQGGALGTLIWFAILFAMSVYLNKFGFMGWLGNHILHFVEGYAWQVVYASLIVAYVLIHYFFVSQTAQMLALFGVFLQVGISAGVQPELMAFMLLFATNFNAMITPQGSSANVIYSSSEYIYAAEIYRIGAVVTLLNTTIFLTLGTLWILFLLHFF